MYIIISSLIQTLNTCLIQTKVFDTNGLHHDACGWSIFSDIMNISSVILNSAWDNLPRLENLKSHITYASRKLTRWPHIVTSYNPLPMEAFVDEDTYKVLISWRSYVELFSDLCVAHECPIPTSIIPDERHMLLGGGGTCLWRKQSEPGPSFILTTCVHAIIQYAFLRGVRMF